MSRRELLLNELRKNPFVLAPMAGITDSPFRTFMKEMGAGIVVSELISATGTVFSSSRTLNLMAFDEVQRPVGLQLFGEEPEHVSRAAQVVQERGADFVDLNFGCPVPKVVKKGAGSAMLKDLPAMERLLKAVVAAVQIPVTIKIRTGWDEKTRNAIDVVNLAADCGITWVAIHGRTRAQGYSGLADWDFISDVKAKTSLPVLGNGDIISAPQAVDALKQSGCDGVLIGRGALKNPYIFAESLSLWSKRPQTQAQVEFSILFERLRELLSAHFDEKLTQIQLKKFAAWFSTGYPDSSHFRKELFQSQRSDEVYQKTIEYFSKIRRNDQLDTSSEAFLMGGHG
jgi:nifR3 family TIM-barrel protein